MEYSDDNLMKLLSQAAHQAGPGPKRGPEGRGDHGDHGDHGDGRWQGKEGRGDHGESGGKVGYPNCPGPGCGNNCPYKGTQDCPKVAARSEAGEDEGRSEHEGRGEHGDHDKHGDHGDGRWQGKEGHGDHGDGRWQGKEGHGDHGEHGDHDKHGERGDGRWQGKEGRGDHGEHGDHDKHGERGDGRWQGKEGRGDHGDHGDDAAHSPMGRERVLTILNDEGSMSQNKLAEKLEIRPQSVSELLGKLESDGYIVRSQNNQDKRESLVSLSEEGKKRADEVRDLQAKHTAEFLAPLDEDEKQTLFNLLTKLTGGKAEE